MKSSVAIVLIICGTILAIVPYINNTIGMHHVTRTMTYLGRDVNLSASLPGYADTLCMVGGIIMIAIGALAGLCKRESK